MVLPLLPFSRSCYDGNIGGDAMQCESYSELFELALTADEKRRLADLAHQERATMRGVLRRLIRDEAERRGLWPVTSAIGQPAAGQLGEGVRP